MSKLKLNFSRFVIRHFAWFHRIHIHTNPGPINPPLVGNIVPAIQCYVAHGGIFNMKTQFKPSLVKPIEKDEEVPHVSRKTVEEN